MFKYFAVTVAAIALIFSSVMVTRALVDSSLSGLDPNILAQVLSAVRADQANVGTGWQPFIPTGGTQVTNGNMRVNGTIHAVEQLCVGEGETPCIRSLRGSWCGLSLNNSNAMDCQGVQLPNCPAGYTHFGGVGLASSLSVFGTCIKN